MSSSKNCLVLDVGKTNVKIHVVHDRHRSLATYTKDNNDLNGAPYPHADVDGIWDWIIEVFSACTAEYDIEAIAISAHGAAAALVDANFGHNGLILPIMDYEWPGVESLNDLYDQIRPPYQETYSPSLAGGLNLGRQLFWLQHHFPDEFNNAEAKLLLYPQYWVWRLSGNMVSEVSSLGCHTDLWSSVRQDYSSLVEHCGWQRLLPPIASAWEVVGTVSESVAAQTGLSEQCRVHVGVHDSNASLLRFLLAKPGEDFCVVSSGTWVVCMATQGSVECLDHTKDMLANVDVMGNNVPCIRFMGGREYGEICARTGSSPNHQATQDDIAQIIKNGAMALPNFGGGSGPFGNRSPEIRVAPHSGVALATLYCALMVDHCLELLQVKGDVIIVGSYLQNPLLCALIAQLREDQTVYVSSDKAGTVRGAAQLSDWSAPVSLSPQQCTPSDVAGLEYYRASWHQQIKETS